ncbi:major facilitator superfamily domain-containing protein [Clohesyomyces aquaticus]|uniref:Major facilitator superfamily domain-containing protein n=1 Tax=Clohesyomyces aquaticus TaxID=1231657 RepID=A0A1Y1ZCI0_9PLEO|nr:major facilitator superfamily domain-containing protein [Clohesyomyces aquaticus]
MVFLGILEDHKLAHVPATVILNEEQSPNHEVTAGLKHGKGKNADIVLIPQPSEDPNDPLNWSPTKKLVVISTIAFGSILYASVLAPLLSPALVVIALTFNKSVGDITQISGYMLLVTACSGPIICALSRKYGKRPLLVASSAFGLLGTIICSATNTYNGLLAGRVIQGFSISAFESLVVSMIGDLYFVHQRGLYMTLMQFILGAASNFSAIIVGPIADNLGWKYLFHILIAFSAFETLALFLFVPETAYNRDHRYDIDELVDDKLSDLAAAEKRHEQLGSGGDMKSTAGESDVVRVETHNSTSPAHRPKKTFIQSLSLYNGTFSNDNLLQLLIAPFAVCTNLAVLWVVIVTGGLTAFFVAQSYDMAQIFMAPPYSLSAAGVGYLSLGPFLGGLVGSIFLGSTLDPLIRWCAKKNNGIYEPEYRLLGMIPSITTTIGLVAFGYLCESKSSYYLTAFTHGLDLFGIVCAAISASAYAIDAYRDMSSEVFIVNMVFKNLLFYGFSYFVNDWTARAGPGTVFYIFGGMGAMMTLTTPVLYFWGKRYRSYWARHNLLEKWGIRTHAEM